MKSNNIFYFSRMKPVLLATMLFACFMAVSQPKESFYVFDKNWESTPIDSARFLLRLRQLNDTCWQWDYYNFTGPLLKSEQTRDKVGEIFHGRNHYFDAAGVLDSIGAYKNGLRHGDFYKLRHNGDSLIYTMKYVYQEDSLLEFINLAKLPKDTSTKYADEKESEYPGGSKRWGYYLEKNLNYPDRAVKGEIEGQVRIGFMVDAAGLVHDLYITKSVEYSLDTESMRMISASGKWKPAFQNGRNVKSYKIQPINYRLR